MNHDSHNQQRRSDLRGPFQPRHLDSHGDAYATDSNTRAFPTEEMACIFGWSAALLSIELTGC